MERGPKQVFAMLARLGLLQPAMNRYLFRKAIGFRGRVAAWRALGVSITDPVMIGPRVEIPVFPEKVSIDRGSRIGGQVTILAWETVTIGRNVVLNGEILLLTGQHDVDSPIFAGQNAPISIGDYAWLPLRIAVLPGVSIGHAAVVGVGSVVSHDVPQFAVVAGNPARVVKQRAKIAFEYEPATGKYG